MSDNPFDVFAADFKAAIPTSESKEEHNNAPPAPINIMPPPSEAPVPVMNTPAMNMNAPPSSSSPPQQQHQHQQQQPPMSGGMSMSMQGGGGGGGPGMGMNGMPPASMNGGYAMGMNPPMMGGMYGAPPPQQQQQQPPSAMVGNVMNPNPQPPTGGAPSMNNSLPMSGGGAMVPSANPTNPYMMSPPPAQYQQPPPPQQQPPQQQQQPQYGAPPPAEPYGNPPVPPSPSPAVSADPFAAPPPPAAAAPVPPADYNPYGAPPPAAMADPWGAAPTAAAAVPNGPPQGGNDAVVPVSNSSEDPFGVFGGGGGGGAGGGAVPPPSNAAPMASGGGYDPNDVLSVATPANPHQLTQEQVLNAVDGGLDPWATGSIASPSVTAGAPGGGGPAPGGALVSQPSHEGGGGSLLGGDVAPVPEQAGEGELPPGGEWYDARIFTPTLGVMFFKPQELNDSLFLQTDKSLVTALQDRPVVAFIVEGSSARAAGVELGHVLLKVNGIDVKNPKEASRLIKEGPRPLPLLFYVPDTTVVVAEGEHMVKYDTRETGAPNSAKDWKPKYVVIGGIIAQPWMMNMYRSKSEYDIAVIETQARRPVSVKVKQFSLQGARVQNDWQGPQMVKYKNKLHPWKYIVILPVSRNPIKISSPNLSQLKPVHEGIRRVLMAQQRHHQQQQQVHSPPPQHHQQPHMGGGHYGGPPPQQQQQYGGPPPQQQQQYGGPPPQQQQQYGGQPESAVVPHPQGNSNPYGEYPGHQQPQGSYEVQGGVGSARRAYQY